jgi:hypothetical protein
MAPPAGPPAPQRSLPPRVTPRPLPPRRASADVSTTRIPVSADQPPPPGKLAGPTAATLVAAGVGCAAFGIAVVASESIAPVKTLFTLSAAVGPLSGKAVAGVLVYLVAWLVLHVLWRRRPIASATVIRGTAVLIGIGLLGTFPPFYGLIAGH